MSDRSTFFPFFCFLLRNVYKYSSGSKARVVGGLFPFDSCEVETRITKLKHFPLTSRNQARIGVDAIRRPGYRSIDPSILRALSQRCQMVLRLLWKKLGKNLRIDLDFRTLNYLRIDYYWSFRRSCLSVDSFEAMLQLSQ